MIKTAPFMDFEFETENATLFPRPETELLVEKAVLVLARGGKTNYAFKILDIGTGCGNIAISLTKYLPSSRITALDILDTALRVAEGNAARHGVRERVEFLRSDLFDSLHERHKNCFDLIISNPPYVARDEFCSLSPSVKDEPYIALYGGRDGMDFYRRIAERAHFYLKRHGILLMEVGCGQADSIKGILKDSGNFRGTEIYNDYSGIARIIEAKKNG